jgi:hypothetical protein
VNKSTKRSAAAVVALAIAASHLMPQRANAQAQVIVPVGAATVILLGIAYYTWTNAVGEVVRVPVADAIIDNPDEPSSEEWDYIWADDYDQAVRRCREIAEKNGGTYSRVVNRTRSTRYECYWWTN